MYDWSDRHIYIFKLADTFDALIVIKHEIRQIVHKDNILTYSETLCNIIIRIESTTKRRMMIDVKAARKDILRNHSRLGEYGVAESMTKATVLLQIFMILEPGKQT